MTTSLFHDRHAYYVDTTGIKIKMAQTSCVFDSQGLKT